MEHEEEKRLGSMSSNRKRATEQLVQGSRKCGKVEEATLVLCFELLHEPRSKYVFEFFRIHDLLWDNHQNKPPDYYENMVLDDGSSEKPIRTLLWEASSFDTDLPYHYMSFLHTSCSSDSSGGLLYAVGGLTPDDADKVGNRIDNKPFSLPTELTRIPLPLSYGGGGDTTVLLLSNKVDRKLSAMKSGKFYPLIVEIGGLIYVLSGYPPHHIKKPPSTTSPAVAKEESSKEYYWFEVYDPQKDTWEQLEDPPFAHSIGGNVYSSPFYICGKYRNLVVGNKLYVSDGMFACVYDTERREWKACNLFEQHYLDKKARGVPHSLTKWELYRLCGWGGENCGLGFPFLGEPILFDEKERIFLCMRKVSQPRKPALTAFQIRGEKAVSFQRVLNRLGIPVGNPRGLVDLGQDFFALLLIEAQQDWELLYGTLVTFKLKLERDDGVDGISTPRRLLATNLRVCYRKPLDGYGDNPIYCFRM